MSAQTPEGERAFMAGMIESLVMRPRDISQAIDFLEDLSQDGVYALMIDLERIGVHGLSYGGYTALLEAGVRLDFSQTGTFCGEAVFRSSLAQAICGMYGNNVPELEALLAETAGVDVAAGETWPSLADPRVDVVAAISPGGALALIADEGLAMSEKPLLILAATADTVANPQFNALRVWEQGHSLERALVVFQNAGHMIAAECSPAMSAAVPLCLDPVWDAARARDLSNHFVTAFLRAELYGDEAARAALAPDAVSFPGITYEAEGF
jgi:predicted dienelactone hydrolase